MKSIYNSLVFLCATTLFLTACKKEVIPFPEENTPVFKAIGTFDGQKIEMFAGDDGMSMKNEVETINGVQKFVSILGNEVYEIELGIIDGQLGLKKDQEDLLNSFSALYFDEKSNVPLYSISKLDFENASTINKIDWYVNGSYKSQNTLEIDEAGVYDICASVLFLSGETKTSCNTLTIGYQNNGDFELDYFTGQDYSLKAWVSESTQAISTVEWYANGVFVSDSTTYVSSIYGSDIKLSAVVRFQNGVVAQKNVLVDGNLTGKFIQDFTKKYETPLTFSDYKILINFKKNGKLYRSHLTDNSTNSFQLNQIEYYKLNANNKPIYLVSGDLSVDMVENEGDSPKKLILHVQFSVELEK